MRRSALAVLAILQWTCVYAQSSTTSDQTATTACPQPGGVHIIVSRGSTETPPYGGLASLKDAILARIPGSTAEGTIGYPNTLEDYFNSSTAGAVIARGLVSDYVRRCPGLPLALLGGSQGANVLGDAVVGQNERGLQTNSSLLLPLPASTLSQVAALILMGDPTFNLTESFHVGNATKPGLFPRQNVENFDIAGIGSRTQSYCDADDVICAGGTSAAVHGSYVRNYGTVAASYVVDKVKDWYAANCSAASGTSVCLGLPAGGTATAVLAHSTSSMVGTTTIASSIATSSATPSSTALLSSQSTGGASTYAVARVVAAAAVFGLVAAV